MRHGNRGHFSATGEISERQFLKDGDLPLATAISEATIAALESIDFVVNPIVLVKQRARESRQKSYASAARVEQDGHW